MGNGGRQEEREWSQMTVPTISYIPPWRILLKSPGSCDRMSLDTIRMVGG